MNKVFKYAALAVFVGAGAGAVAHADEASTAGGIKIKSADGNFDASIGGRLHFDAYGVIPDGSAKFGSGPSSGAEKNDFSFRRAYITLGGHLYGFEYKMDYDFAASSVQDFWFAHALLGNDTVYIGQHKPWRSLDEIASNNNTPFMERNITSATGVYGGVDYTNGLYYSWNKSVFGTTDNLWLGASVYSLHKLTGYSCTAATTTTTTDANTGDIKTVTTTGGTCSGDNGDTQGLGYNARIAYAPIVDKDKWAHVGVAYSSDNVDTGGYGFKPAYNYAGRKGPSLTLASYSAVGSGKSGNPHADIIHGELGGAYGPAYFMGEFVDAGYHQNGKLDNTVYAYSVTGAYIVTGETRPYNKRDASYGAVKPAHAYGAVELALRYDYAHNDKHGGSYVGCTGAPSGTTADKCSVSMITFGVNYYLNPAVRFMFDYEHGEAKLGGTAGKDSPDAVMARAQLVF